MHFSISLTQKRDDTIKCLNILLVSWNCSAVKEVWMWKKILRESRKLFTEVDSKTGITNEKNVLEDYPKKDLILITTQGYWVVIKWIKDFTWIYAG